MSGMYTSGALVTWMRTAAGAVRRWVSDKLAEQISVKDFGAVGDGIADDTLAFQRAIDHIATLTHTFDSLVLGARLLIPDGSYKLGKLVITSPISIEGNGAEATRLILKPGVNDDLLYFNGVNFAGVRKLTIDGNKANNAAPAINKGNGLAFNECTRVVVQDMEIRNCKGNGWITLGGSFFTYDNCRLIGNDANGTYHTTTATALDNGTAYITGSTSHAMDNGYDGFCFDPGSACCTLTACESISNGGTGFNIYGNSSGIYPREVVLSGCIAQDNDLEGFSCHACESVTLSGIQSINNGRINVGTRIGGVVISDDAAGQHKPTRIVIDGFLIVGPNGHGIDINSANTNHVTSVILSDGIIENVGGNASNTWDGIALEDVQDVYLSNVYVLDSRGPKLMRYGLSTTSGSTRVRVVGGNIGAGLTGDFNLTSLSTLITTEVSGDEFSIRTDVLDKGLKVYGNERPRVTLAADGPAALVRLYEREASWYAGGIWNNLQWNGNWVLDDITRPGWDDSTDVDADCYQVRRASAGAGARAMVTLFKISGSQAAGETCAYLYVNDGAATTLRRVTVGAADSGGAGYRALRVAN